MLSAAKRIMARAPTYVTYVRERPGWILLIVFGRLKWVRRIERAVRAKPYLVSTLPPSASVETPDAMTVATLLARDGAVEGFRLLDDVLQEIRAFAENNPCSTRDDEPVSFLPKDLDKANASRKKDVLAAYYFSSVEQCPAINELVDDARLLEIAQNYVGRGAKNIRARLWWNFPATRYDDADLHATAQDKFHFDLNDWRTVKFFFYLTDVDLNAAPHLYIRGSHVNRGLEHQYTILQGKPKDALEAYYGAAEFRTVVGPAGSGFAEDPFVFHTGSTAISAARLLLELEFGPYDPSPSYRYGVLG